MELEISISLHAIQWIFPFPRDAWTENRSRNLLHRDGYISKQNK